MASSVEPPPLNAQLPPLPPSALLPPRPPRKLNTTTSTPSPSAASRKAPSATISLPSPTTTGFRKPASAASSSARSQPPSSSWGSAPLTETQRERCWWIGKNRVPTDNRDFVLIAEFSEMEGPVALATVPAGMVNLGKDMPEKRGEKEARTLESEADTLPQLIDFDVNAFVMRVVSVDHNVRGRSGAEESFRIPEDTQVYLMDSEQQYYYYVHHLTLFDITARGFVRPVTLAYVTKDPHKILGGFMDFVRRFGEVSKILKTGNFAMFRDELERRLQDLEYTKRVAEEKNSSTLGFQDLPTPFPIDDPAFDTTGLTPPPTPNLPTPDSLEAAIALTNLILDTVSHHSILSPPLPIFSEDPDMIPSISSSSSDLLATSSRANSVANSRSSSVIKLGMTPVRTSPQRPIIAASAFSPLPSFAPPAVSAAGVVPERVENKGVAHRRRIKSQEVLGGEGVIEEIVGAVPVIAMPAIATVMGWGALGNADDYVFADDWEKTADYQPRLIPTLYPPTRFDTRLRSLDELCTPPSRYHAEGDIAVELEDEGSSYQHALRELEDLLRDLGRPSAVVKVEKEDLRITAPLSSTISVGRTLIMNFKNPLPRRLGSATPFYSDPSDVENDRNFIIKGGRPLPDEPDDDDFSSTDGNESPPPYTPFSDKISSSPSISSFSSASHRSMHRTSEASSRSPVSLHRSAALPQQADESSPRSSSHHDDDEEEEETPRATHKDRFPLQIVGDQIWAGEDDVRPGRGILEVVRRYRGFVKHVAFALLIGRPVVVVGEIERKSDITIFITALSALVPGQLRHRHRIVQWYTAKPRLSSKEIRHMKLVGVERDRLNTSVFESHVSVVDLDADRGEGSLMTGGLYLSGMWLEELVARADESRTDGSFLAHLHTLFFHISLKAYAFHHMFLHPSYIEEFLHDVTPSTATNLTITTAETPTQRRSSDAGMSSSASSTARKWSMRGLMEYLKLSDDKAKEKEKESNSAGKDGVKADESSVDFNTLSTAMLDKPVSERGRRGSFLSLGRLWGNGEGEETKGESQQQESNQQSVAEGKARTGKCQAQAMDQQQGEATSAAMEDLNEKTVTLKSTVFGQGTLSLNTLGLLQGGQGVEARAEPEMNKPTTYDVSEDPPEPRSTTSPTPTSERAHRIASAMPRLMPVQPPDLRLRNIYGSMSSGMSSGTVSSFYSLASPTDTSFGSFVSFGEDGGDEREQREQEEGDTDGLASVGGGSEGWAGDRAEERENENDGDNDGAVELSDLSEEGRKVMEEILDVIGDDQAIVLHIAKLTDG